MTSDAPDRSGEIEMAAASQTLIDASFVQTENYQYSYFH
jgi:hypothetical protein